MAKKNRLKPSKASPTPKKKTSSGGSGGFKKFLSDQRTHRIGGLLIFFFCIYCLIAFTSFMFTWKADQSMLSDNWWAVLREGNYDAENWLGPLGAMVGHMFIHRWFGVMSFLFILVFFNFGFKVLFKKNLLPPLKTTLVSILGMVIFSPLLAYLFRAENAQFVGGAFGYDLNHTLYGVVGQVGTGILLFFAAIAFIIAVFNPSFAWLGRLTTRIGLGFENTFAKVKDKAMEVRDAAMEDDEEDQKVAFQDTIGEIDNFKPSAADVVMSDEDFEDVVMQPVPEPKKKKEKEPEFETIIPEPEPQSEARSEKSDKELLVEVSKKEKELSVEELNQKVSDFGEYDPTLDLANYQMPGIDLLEEYGSGTLNVSKEE